jgi:predicted nucleic acid-binding protein
MTRFLIATDVFVDHLRAEHRIPFAPKDAAYCSITRAELYAGKNADEPIIDLLLGAFEEIGVTREIAEQGGRITRSLEIPLPDALLAATAIICRSVLVTRNVGNLGRVAGLQLDSPR